MTEPITRELTLHCSAEHAFASFTTEFGSWWPPEYTWSGAGLESIALSHGVGDCCSEIGPAGFRLDWGTILGWEPGERLLFSWHIGADRVPCPNPGDASTIEVRFEQVPGAHSRLIFEHRDLDRHGDTAEAYRAALDSDAGWTFILQRFVEYANKTGG